MVYVMSEEDYKMSKKEESKKLKEEAVEETEELKKESDSDTKKEEVIESKPAEEEAKPEVKEEPEAEEPVKDEEKPVEKAEEPVKEEPVEPVEEKEFVEKKELDDISEDLKSLKKEHKEEISKYEVETAKLSDSIKIIEQKDKLIATYQEKVKIAEKMIAKYENEKLQAVQAKSQAKFETIFEKYCRFHKIPKSEMQVTKKELSTLSESVLETIDRDVSRAMETFVSESEVIQNSEELTAISVEAVTEEEETTPEKKIDALFDKMRQING